MQFLVCVNISYISEDIGLKLSLSFDNYSFISEEISVRNPPPVCFDIPHLREYASLCMRLYQVFFKCPLNRSYLLHKFLSDGC